MGLATNMPACVIDTTCDKEGDPCERLGVRHEQQAEEQREYWIAELGGPGISPFKVVAVPAILASS